MAWASAGASSALPGGGRPKPDLGGEALVRENPALHGPGRSWGLGHSAGQRGMAAGWGGGVSTAAFLKCFWYVFKYKKLNPFYDPKLTKVL